MPIQNVNELGLELALGLSSSIGGQPHNMSALGRHYSSLLHILVLCFATGC